MTGKVNAAREAVVRIKVLGAGKSSRTVNAVIDTGYTGSLSLPPAAVRSLGMRFFGKRRAELADGRVVTFDVYAGSVIWNGRPVAVEIDESPCDPLIGMKLLEGFELNIGFCWRCNVAAGAIRPAIPRVHAYVFAAAVAVAAYGTFFAMP